jgi:hypothetical protein
MSRQIVSMAWIGGFNYSVLIAYNDNSVELWALSGDWGTLAFVALVKPAG